jgi:aspartate 1-decarboxylase
MLRYVCKSKIHRATITEANLKYMGSITIDSLLLKAADILPYERVQVLNLNNGSRVETYTIEGKAGTGVICLNGPASRWGEAGDEIIIVSYGLFSEEELKKFKPKIIFVNKKNRIKT